MPTRIFASSAEPLPEAVLAGWSRVAVTIAADLAQGRTLVDPAIRPLRPFGNGPRLVGRAVTAWCEPADYGPVHHAIAVAGPGDVLLITAGGRMDAAMIGELLGGAARLKGIRGLVCDGPVRDVGTLAAWPDFPVFSRGAVARGPSSMERGTVGEPITLGGIPAMPGDLVLGDDDGVVIIPRHLADGAMLDAGLARAEAEIGWERELATGKSTLDVFKVPKAERMG